LVNERVEGDLIYKRSPVEQVSASAVFAVAAVAVLALLFTGGGTPIVWLPVVVAVVSGAEALVVSSLNVGTGGGQIVVHRIGEDQAMRWSEVSAYYLPRRMARVMLKVTTGPWGVLTLVNGADPKLSMRLVSTDGKRVDVPKRMRANGNGALLGKLVQQRVVGQIYEPIRTAFDNGETVEFGRVSLSVQTGLVFKKTHVPPNELRTYSLLVRRGKLVLARGKKPQRGDPKIRWSRVPDVDIFLSLFYELKRRAPLGSWA
jgi:hypothetical protein